MKHNLKFRIMKIKGFIVFAMFAIVACSNTTNEQVEKIKSLAKQDSLKAAKSNYKDSLITAYLGDLNDIQDNLDQIKEREKIITMKPAEMNTADKQTVVAEIKELDNWIVDNDKKINGLQSGLKNMDTKYPKLERLVARLTQQTAEQDEEIAGLQAKLSKADDSIRLFTSRLNDSILVIRKQRMDIAELNTVYYISGTMKELREKGVIDKDGGVIGLGRVAELKPSVNNTLFIKVNLTTFKGLNLHHKFRRFITTHPDKAYQIISTGKTDSIAINMPSTFWSESKYLVIATR